jgi:uncharacterized membrane protein
MTPAVLTGYVVVPVYGALMCSVPAVTRPTLQFGVRVPPARTGAPVIQRERHTYYWRSAVVAVCCAAALLIARGSGSWWLPRVILLLEVAADVSCFRLARRKIIAVKTAEGWFAGLRQTVVADTSWRTQPQRFPARWLIPVACVVAATAVTGYFHPAASGGHQAARPFTALIAQLYVTSMWTGMMVLIYRSRPDIDPADPAASLRGYRSILDRYARAVLTMLALVDLTLLLASLRLRGTGILVPAAVGVLIVLAVAGRAGRDRVRQAAAAAGTGSIAGQRRAAVVGRDDDRFWKAGLIYVNRDDPAIMVTARISVGWTLNFGNPAAWLIVGVIVATGAGLAVIKIVTGM